jgi:hypothetical protein
LELCKIFYTVYGNTECCQNFTYTLFDLPKTKTPGKTDIREYALNRIIFLFNLNAV